MDNPKDIQKANSIGRFMDSFSPKTSPFGQNRIGDRAYRRSERLSAAIVLLTNHVPQDEPLRVSARKLSLSMIGLLLEIRNEMRSSDTNNISALKGTVRQLISVVRLLAVSGYMSVQNADTVTEALDGLTEFIHASQKSSLAESISISRDDLIDVREDSNRHGSVIRDSARDKSTSVRESSKTTDSSQILSQNNVSNISARALSILEILRLGRELGIREIAANLPEYSEKMIQRELAELARLGKIKKEGLKRWSRYSII